MIKDSQAKIIHKESWKDYYLFSFQSEKIAAQAMPGQFLMVRIEPSPYPLLRRPFSIHSRNENTLEIFFKIEGIGTQLLAQKEIDDSLDLLGPLGKGFRFGVNLEKKAVAVVGGGRGIAPLYFLAEELRLLGVGAKIFYGGKSEADLPLREKFEKNGFDLSCSTDDGSFAFKGMVTDLLQTELERFFPASIFACGPEEMLKKIADMAINRKIPAELSLESMMGCGFGACWGCVRRIKRGKREEWLKICEEGPVFSSKEIIWLEEER